MRYLSSIYSFTVCVDVHIFIYLYCIYNWYGYCCQDSIDKVEELLKKQEDFEKMLSAQEDRFHLLNRETKVLYTYYIYNYYMY